RRSGGGPRQQAPRSGRARRGPARVRGLPRGREGGPFRPGPGHHPLINRRIPRAATRGILLLLRLSQRSATGRTVTFVTVHAGRVARHPSELTMNCPLLAGKTPNVIARAG